MGELRTIGGDLAALISRCAELAARNEAERPALSIVPDDMAARQAARVRKQAAACGVPERFLRVLCEGRDVETQATLLLDRMLGAAGDDGAQVVLGGQVNAGKSFAAAREVWMQCLRAGGCDPLPALWRRCVDLAIADTYRTDWRALHRAPLLVLDDLGVEFMAGQWPSVLDALLDGRWSACLPTIVTTNMRRADFEARYHERAWKRLGAGDGFIELGEQWDAEAGA